MSLPFCLPNLIFGIIPSISVFECIVDPTQWAQLRKKLTDEIDPEKDSLRFYFLGSNWKRRVEHLGAKEIIDLEGPLIVLPIILY